MAGFGIGLGAFMNGVTQGAQAAQSIKNGNARQKLIDLEVKNAESAAAANDQARSIATQGMQDAKANTDGSYDAEVNYYNTKVVPKLQQHWMAQGDIPRAEAFGKWMQDQNVQQGLRLGAGLIRSVQTGDMDAAKDYMLKIHNQPGYIEDGMTSSDGKVIRDDKGNVTGMEFTLTNDQTGKKTTQKFNTLDEVTKFALMMGQPDQIFKAGMDTLAAGQKAQAEIAKEQRGLGIDDYKARRDQGYKLEDQNNASMLRRAEEAEKNKDGKGSNVSRDAQAKISLLRQAGKTDAEINAMMPSIVGVENKSRPMSSRIDDAVKVLSETNNQFARLPTDEKLKQAKMYVDQLDKLTGENQSPAGLTTKSGQQNTQQQQAVPYFDTKTGQIISRPY